MKDNQLETRIRDLILAKVPEDGSTLGNASLLREVQQALEAEGREYDEEAVHAAREQLIGEGVLGKGRGRGGSVYRKASAAGRRPNRPARRSPAMASTAAISTPTRPGCGPMWGFRINPTWYGTRRPIATTPAWRRSWSGTRTRSGSSPSGC